MFRNIFSNIEGINSLPIVAMLIFLVMFILIVIYVIKLDKKTENEMAEIPLKDNINSEI